MIGMLNNWLLLIAGIGTIIIGVINFTGDISTVRKIWRENVRKEDTVKFGRVIGIGTVVMGIALIVVMVLQIIYKVPFTAVLIPAAIIWVMSDIVAQVNYNK